MNTFDVTVRIPVAFESAVEAAGFIERSVSKSMNDSKFTGSPFIIFKDRDGKLFSFMNGIGVQEYKGVFPHTVCDHTNHR
jgi:hypothetical protein